jgi:hypothetical protein
MVTDEQVRRLRKLSNTEKNQEIAAAKAGMDPTTARRYRGLERLLSELKKGRPWRTRGDPFSEVWDAVQKQIEESPGLEAKTLFEWLQREYPGPFSDGQDPNAATANQTMASDGRACEGSVFRSGARAGAAVRVGFYAHG